MLKHLAVSSVNYFTHTHFSGDFLFFFCHLSISLYSFCLRACLCNFKRFKVIISFFNQLCVCVASQSMWTYFTFVTHRHSSSIILIYSLTFKLLRFKIRLLFIYQCCILLTYFPSYYSKSEGSRCRFEKARTSQFVHRVQK